MGTTSEKLTYLNETKSQLKETINYAGAGLTDETFRQYPSKLYDKYLDILKDNGEALFNGLPKELGSGTSLSMNNTANTRMKMSLAPSELEQATTTGKNLFNKNTTVSSSAHCSYTFNNGIYTITNTDTSNPSLTLRVNLPAGSYTLNSASSLGTATQIRNASDAYITSLGGDYAYKTFTINENAGYIRFNWTSTTNPIILNLNTLFIVAGTYTSSTMPNYEEYTGGIASPNPDYPQDIHTISGDNNVYVNTKNLGYEGWAEDFVNRINNDTKAKLETVDNRNCLFYNASVGYQEYDTKYIFKTNFKENTRYTFKFMLKMSTSYTSNLALYYTDGTTEQISSNQSANIWTTCRFTSASGKTIKYLKAYYSSGNCYIDLDTFQVEEGTTVGDYEKGYQQLFPLTLGTLEVCKIGNYADEFYLATASDTSLVAGKWYLKKNIGKVVLDGSEDESWSNHNTLNNISSFRTSLSNFVVGNIFSNRYQYQAWSSFNSGARELYRISMLTSGTNYYLYISQPNENVNTLELVKQWLSNNNLSMYYILATPEYTLLNDTLQEELNNIKKALSYQDQTNISQENNDLPFVISASAIKEYDLNEI